MIQYAQIEKLFTFDSKRKFCVKIQFKLRGNPKFDYC